MGIIPSRHIDRRAGRSNPSDRSNINVEADSDSSFRLVPSGRFHFVDHTIGEDTPEVVESSSEVNDAAEQTEGDEKIESNTSAPKPEADAEEVPPEPPKASDAEISSTAEKEEASGESLKIEGCCNSLYYNFSIIDVFLFA